MKKIIVKISPNISESQQKSLLQISLNQGFTAFYLTGDLAIKLAGIEKREIFTTDRNLKDVNYVLDGTVEDPLKSPIPSKETYGFELSIKSKDDEKKALRLAESGPDFLICHAVDWKVIPFENLIAKLHGKNTQLYADVESSIHDANLLLHTLEKGVDGLVFFPKSENDLIELKKILKQSLTVPLEPAIIKSIKPIPEADRVCVDTSSILHVGEGMLVGNTARGFALVHAEVFESEFVNSRPFRVNAGDVSDYILVPQFNSDGSISTRTNYLSELKAGDSILIVNRSGDTRIVSIGRVKIETRPMLLFELEITKEKRKIPIIITVQNAETVRLIDFEGNPVAVTKLKPQDKIMVHIGVGATHFGTAIKENIIER